MEASRDIPINSNFWSKLFFFFSCKFLSIFGHQNPGSGSRSVPIQPKMLGPDHMNTYPKHWFKMILWTYYPSSSKNLTTTRGILRNPSLISSGREARPFTSPGQKSPPHLHHTASPSRYLLNTQNTWLRNSTTDERICDKVPVFIYPSTHHYLFTKMCCRNLWSLHFFTIRTEL